jgi:hypothetical protein
MPTRVPLTQPECGTCPCLIYLINQVPGLQHNQRKQENAAKVTASGWSSLTPLLKTSRPSFLNGSTATLGYAAHRAHRFCYAAHLLRDNQPSSREASGTGPSWRILSPPVVGWLARWAAGWCSHIYHRFAGLYLASGRSKGHLVQSVDAYQLSLTWEIFVLYEN